MKRIGLMFFALTMLMPVSGHCGGFRTPYPSTASMALAGARIAHTPGPDAGGVNPANLVFLEDRWQLEASLTNLYLPSITYEDNRTTAFNGESEEELIFLPQGHLASSRYGDVRFGFSLMTPFGMEKEWEQPYPRMTVERFGLSVYEINPTMSYGVGKHLSFGAGIRLALAEGKAKSLVTNPPATALTPLSQINRSVKGSDSQFGYNLGLSLRPGGGLSLAATYRSKMDLQLEGDATLTALAGPSTAARYDGRAILDLTLPASLAIALAWTDGPWTVEAVWDRTFWSSYEALDFQYGQSFLGTVFDPFDRVQTKNWQDTDAWRLGLTYRVDERVSCMLGFAYDRTPIPEENLGFDLPGADAYIFSGGLEMRYSENLTLSLAYLHHHSEERSVQTPTSGGLPNIDGVFSDGGAHVLTIGFAYVF